MQQVLDSDARDPGDWLDLSQCANRTPWRPAGRCDSTTEPLTTIAAKWFCCSPENILPILSRSCFYDLIKKDFSKKEIATIISPGAPFGQEWTLAAMAKRARSLDALIMDGRFADPRPDLSLTCHMPHNVLSLRDCADFWGIPDIAFVIAKAPILARLARRLPPPADFAARTAAIALSDTAWADEIIVYLAEACLRLDMHASRRGWQPMGGTHLFRYYATIEPQAEKARLEAENIRIWKDPNAPHLLRLAIPKRDEWDRIARAFTPR